LAKKTPLEIQVEKQLNIAEEQAKMDKKLAKYGHKVQGGMLWTVGDLQRFFRDTIKKKRKRR